MSKIENAKRNIVAGFINKVITLAGPFIIRSIIIWKLGMEYVGLGTLFTSILQVLSLAELGFGSAIVFSMYEPLSNNDTDSICALMNFYRRIYRIVGTVILCVGLIIMPFLDDLISSDIPSDINIYILYVIYLVNTASSYFLSAYKQSLLMATERYDVDTKISTYSYIFMYIIQIFVLWVSDNYYLYCIWLPISTLLINFYRSFKVKKMYPEYVCTGDISDIQKKDLYKRVFGIMLTRVSQVFRNSLDSIVISAYLGLIALGKYQNYYYIMNTIVGFMSIVTSSVMAGIGNNIATKNSEQNYAQFKVFTFSYNWLASWCTVCLLCLYQPFMKLWVGTENTYPFVIVILMCLYFYSLKVGDIAAVYKEAAGLYWEDRFRPVVESILNLTLNFALVIKFGVYGVVLSTIISLAFVNIPWAANTLFKYYFKTSPFDYYKSILAKTLLLILTSAITYYICQSVFLKGISFLVVSGVICIIVPNIIYWAIYFRTSEFKYFKKLLTKYINR